MSDTHSDKYRSECSWSEDGYGVWSTECREVHSFEIDGDGQKENLYKFCPYCGKPVVVSETTFDVPTRLPKYQAGDLLEPRDKIMEGYLMSQEEDEKKWRKWLASKGEAERDDEKSR